MIIKKRDRNYLQIAKETELGQALRGGSGADLVRVQWVQLNSQIWGKKKKKKESDKRGKKNPYKNPAPRLLS